ncbi:MAG TPA: hypothetical protein VL966_06185 [Alphaproteobacteria bacterium]|nr:hypothetical protein [Alphaproteobacteria bacterium]
MARNSASLAERYRRRAEELRALAADMADGEARAAVLHAAKGYDDLVRLAATYDLRGDPDVTE